MNKILLILTMIFLIGCEGEENGFDIESTLPRVVDAVPGTPVVDVVAAPGNFSIQVIYTPTSPTCNKTGFDLSVFDLSPIIADQLRVMFFNDNSPGGRSLEVLGSTISNNRIKFTHEFTRDDGVWVAQDIMGVFNSHRSRIDIDLGCGQPLSLSVVAN